jgi:hypothetical protein
MTTDTDTGMVPDPQPEQELTGTVHPPGTSLALTQADIDVILAPATISLKEWLIGITTEDDFPESDPEAMALGMLAQILQAKTSEEALTAFQVDRAKTMCGDTPGGKSAVLEIRGARPLRSDYAEGSACYVVVDAVRAVDGELARFTTGSKAVQMVILKHVWEGWMPFHAMLEIRSEKTKKGFYPLNLVQGI